LKLGPLEIRMAARKSARPSMDEMGATGTQIFGGLLTQQDYNSALIAPTLYDKYDEMRNDCQVKAALTVIKLPLLNADWSVEPASDTPQDRQIAEFIEEDLMNGMTVSWPDILRQALLMLDYGSMPFEKVWRLGEDGLVHLRKLAPRMPKTVLFWLVDETGGLAGIRQAAPSASLGLKIVEIPVDKLLVFVNDLEGSNFRGTSILRSAYKHHYYKDNLYRVQAIAIEKRAMGIDVGTLQGEARTEANKDKLERSLAGIHAHEKNYFVEVEEQYKYRLETGMGGRLLDPQEAIEHHDLRIVRSMIAEFVAMGAGSTGSLAMHRDKTSYLLLALGGIANYICETVSKHLIRQWVDYNWPGLTAYPRLRYSRLEQRDVAVFADAVEKLAKSGALTADPTLEEEARSLLSLPRLEAGDAMQQPDEEPAPVAAAREKQAAKLIEIAQNLFSKGQTAEIGAVSVPYKADLAAALGGGGDAEVESQRRAAAMKAAFIEEMVRQLKTKEFDAARLKKALLEA